jgi:hypothetical protein
VAADARRCVHFFDYERTTVLDASALVRSDAGPVDVQVSATTHEMSWEWAGLHIRSWLTPSIKGAVP